MKSENSKDDMCQSTDNEKLRRSINRNTDRLDSLAKEVKQLKEASAYTASPMPVAIYDPHPAPQPFPNDYATTGDLNKEATVMSRMDTSIRTLAGKISNTASPTFGKEQAQELIDRVIKLDREEVVKAHKAAEKKAQAEALVEYHNSHKAPPATESECASYFSRIMNELNVRNDEDWLKKRFHYTLIALLIVFDIAAVAIWFGIKLWQENRELQRVEWAYRALRSDEEDNEKLQNFERDLFYGSKEQREATGPSFIHFHPHDDWRPKKKEE